MGDAASAAARLGLSRFNSGRMKVAKVIRALEADGWRLARTRGSHRQYRHPSKPGLVTVSGKPSAELPPKTLASIRRQAGLEDLS